MPVKNPLLSTVATAGLLVLHVLPAIAGIAEAATTSFLHILDGEAIEVGAGNTWKVMLSEQ